MKKEGNKLELGTCFFLALENSHTERVDAEWKSAGGKDCHLIVPFAHRKKKDARSEQVEEREPLKF